CQSSKKTDDGSLSQENPDDLRNVCTESLEDAYLSALLHRHSDECAHDSKRRDNYDEKQQEKHHAALETHGFKELVVHVNPGLCVLWWLEKRFNGPFDPLGAIWVVSSDCDSVQPVLQPV